jgi:hypothetical protein
MGSRRTRRPGRFRRSSRHGSRRLGAIFHKQDGNKQGAQEAFIPLVVTLATLIETLLM